MQLLWSFYRPGKQLFTEAPVIATKHSETACLHQRHSPCRPWIGLFLRFSPFYLGKGDDVSLLVETGQWGRRTCGPRQVILGNTVSVVYLWEFNIYSWRRNISLKECPAVCDFTHRDFLSWKHVFISAEKVCNLSVLQSLLMRKFLQKLLTDTDLNVLSILNSCHNRRMIHGYRS